MGLFSGKKAQRLFNTGALSFALFLLLTLYVNCAKMNSAVTKDLSSSEFSNSPNTLQLGLKIYSTQCASCHENISSSTKTGASFLTIKEALQKIPSMTFIKLSDGEIMALAAILNSAKTIEGASTALSISAPIGTREFMASVMNDLFVNSANPTGEDTAIKSLIDDLILNQVAAYGGPCRVYEQNCPGGINMNIINVAVSMQPPGIATRKGYTLRACQSILAKDRAVRNAMALVSIDSSVSPTFETLGKIQDVFTPGRPSTSSIINELLNLSILAKNSGMTSLDQWRMVMLPLCSSAALEVL